MTSSGVSFLAGGASAKNNNDTNNSNFFDASTVFAPISTSGAAAATKYSHTLILSQAGVQQKTELKFDWNTSQENLFGALVDQIIAKLAMNGTSKQSVTLMATTPAAGDQEEENFSVFGDTQLRSILLSTDQKNKIKIVVGARRRSVLSQAVEATCTSGLSGDSFGHQGAFRFRFLPDNTQLLSDFKAECMDALDLFGAEEDSFDLHHVEQNQPGVPILSSHSLERLLNTILARADEKMHKISFKLVPASATLIAQAAPDDSGRADRADASTVNAEDLFAPTSTRDYCRTFTVTNGETGAKVNITFTWQTHQDNIYQDFSAEIKKALKLSVNESQQALSLTATVDGESFAIFGDNQLRGMLASVPENQAISITTSTRRRSIGSVLSKAVQITALSALSGEALGETAVFRFRFLPDNENLLSDFKCECMDALDLFGSEESSFDIHIKEGGDNYIPVLSSHSLERKLGDALKKDAVITNVDVKLVPASATDAGLASANDSGRAGRFDADTLFNASTADGLISTATAASTHEKRITAVASATGAKAEFIFQWTVEQENLYGILCAKISGILKLTALPQQEALLLTATVSDETFPIYGDNQLRNLLSSISKETPLKFTVASRRRSVGSVMARAVQITALSALSGEALGETAVFRFRFLPDNENLLSDFKCECMDALDLFGSEESSFDIHIKEGSDSYIPVLSSHSLERKLGDALKKDAVITNVDVKLVPASATDAGLASANDSGRAGRFDADTLFNASTADGLISTATAASTHEKRITAVASATGAKAEFIFQWTVEQENLYGILCAKISGILKLTALPQQEALLLTATVSDETFPIYGDNQLRNLLSSISKETPLKFTVASRRRSVGSVMARALMCSCINNIEKPESATGESATFRFRYLPDDSDNVLSLFKCEIMDALDLFGSEEDSFDVQIKKENNDKSWVSLTTAAALKSELDHILASNDAAMIIPFRVIASPNHKTTSSRNSPNRVHVSLGDENSSETCDVDADFYDPHLLQSLTSATAGVFHLSTASAIRLFGVAEDGTRREIVDDDTARSAIAERLRLIAVSALDHEHGIHFNKSSNQAQEAFEAARKQHEEEEERNKAKKIKVGVSLVQYMANNNNNNNTNNNNIPSSSSAGAESSKKSDISSSAPNTQSRIITFDHEVTTLSARADQNGSLHELRKACAKQLNLDLFAGDTLELYVQTDSSSSELLELTQDKQLSAAVTKAQESSSPKPDSEPLLHVSYKGSLHPSRRNRFITIKATELQKRGVDYVEVVDNVYEFSPITVNPNLINELRSVVARSLKSTLALRHIQVSEINDQKNPYILEASLDTEWINVSSNKAAHAMLRALTENSAGHLSLRIKPPVPPPQDWEICLTVFFHGDAFRHNVVFVDGTTADFHIIFTELKKICDVPFERLDTVTLDEALPATRSDRQIRDAAALTRIFTEAIHEKAFPETFRRSVILRVEDTVSAATINAERSESDKRKLKSVFYTASFQGAASIHPQDGRVDVDINKKQNILVDLKDLLLDNLRVPRLSGDEIGIFIATAGSSSSPQHMMNDQQLVDFLNLVGDDNSAENRLQIIFRSSKGTGQGNNNISSSSPSSSTTNVQLSRADVIQDIANCWTQLSGGASNVINIEDVRITFTTWTDGLTLDPQQTALKRFNDVSTWAGEVTGKENLIPILRDMLGHLSDFALANFRAHARDMANFVEDVSSASKSSRMLATAFRAYAVDGLVTRDFLLRGLVDSDLASKDKAESVLSAYGESLNEEDFVEVLSYFVGDDSLALHKILCAAAPKRPQWVGSPRRDEEVTHRHETRLRIELRHAMDYLYPESFVSFFSTFNPDTGSHAKKQVNQTPSAPTKQQTQAVALRAIAWCLACLLQHPSAVASDHSDNESNNKSNKANLPAEDEDHEASWIWFKNFVTTQENTENFLHLLRTTERVPVSRNTLALVASRLLSRDLEKGSLLAISNVVAQLGQWCTLVLQLSCLTRDISYPPEFIPSQPDFESLAAQSPRARKIGDKNTVVSAPRQTEAYRLAGVAPPRPGTSSNQNSPRKSTASASIVTIGENASDSTPDRNTSRGIDQANDRSTNDDASNSALVIAPSPPAPSPAGRRTGASTRYYQPRYASTASGSYGLAKKSEQTLEEVLRSAADTKNAAAGAVMQTKLAATHFLFTIAQIIDFGAAPASGSAGKAPSSAAVASGSVYVVVLDDSKGEKKEIFRTPATNLSSKTTEFSIPSARFLVPISGPAMTYIFQIRAATRDEKIIASARWAASRTGKEEDLDNTFIKPENDMLALKFTSANEEGRLGSAATNGTLAVMLTRQKELAAIPKDPQQVVNSMIQVTLESIGRGPAKPQPKNTSTTNHKNETASSDSDDDPELKLNSGDANPAANDGAFYIRAINDLGETVFTLGKQQGSGSSISTNRVAVVELERVLPYVTLQRVPQTVGSREDDVTDSVDITATKFVASRTIEESLKPVITFVRNEVEKEGYSVVRDGPPLILKLASIGFDRVAPPAPKDEVAVVGASSSMKAQGNANEEIDEM